jgi:membrane protease YdiL (CAAX protease family)
VSSLIRLHGVLGWALIALVLVPLAVLLSIVIWNILGRQSYAVQQFSATGLVLLGLIVITLLYQQFFFNAAGEEVGWRGFALPRLQSITNPLVACLLINLFWPLWHVFYWAAEGKPIFSPGYWVHTYLELLPATGIICWLYNRSKGSILVAGITHAAANTAYAFFPNLDWQVFDWTVAVVALVLVVIDRMWKKLPPDHPAVCISPQSTAQHARMELNWPSA